jgi:hypothetical protein
MSAIAHQLGYFSREGNDPNRTHVLLVQRGEGAERWLAGTDARPFRQFANNADLSIFVEHIREKTKRNRATQLLSAMVNALLMRGTIQFGGQDVSLSLSAMTRWGLGRDGVEPICLLRKDEMTEETVAGFIQAIGPMPGDNRPKVIHDCEGDFEGARRLLSNVARSVNAFTFSPDRYTPVSIAPASATRETMAGLLAAQAFDACSQVEVSLDATVSDLGALTSDLMLATLKIAALKYENKKFAARPTMRALKQTLKLLKGERRRSLDADHRRLLAEIEFFALLDESYVFEDHVNRISEAALLADRLKAPVLRAVADRFTNLTDGVTAEAEERLLRAAGTLSANGHPVWSAYASLNAIVTSMHCGRRSLARAVDRIPKIHDFIEEHLPNDSRRSSINGALGAAHLLLGANEKAREFFDQGSDLPGAAMHQASARVNALIAEAVDSGSASERKIESVFAFVKKSAIPTELNYHNFYILVNLYKMSRSRQLQTEILDYIEYHGFLNCPREVVSHGDAWRFMAQRFDFVAADGRMKGVRGDFVEKYDLFPIAHFLWN